MLKEHHLFDNVVEIAPSEFMGHGVVEGTSLPLRDPGDPGGAPRINKGRGISLLPISSLACIITVLQASLRCHR